MIRENIRRMRAADMNGSIKNSVGALASTLFFIS